MSNYKKVQDVSQVLKNHWENKCLADAGDPKKVKVPYIADSSRCLGCRTSTGQWERSKRQEVTERSANHEVGSQLHYEGFADNTMVWALLPEKSAEKTVLHRKRRKLILGVYKSHHLRHVCLQILQNLLNIGTVQKVGFLSCHKSHTLIFFILKQ